MRAHVGARSGGRIYLATAAGARPLAALRGDVRRPRRALGVVYYGVALDSQAFRRYLEVSRRSAARSRPLTDGIRSAAPDHRLALHRRDRARLRRLPHLRAAGGCVLAFPATWRAKAVGLVLRLVWLNALNFVRICGLYFIGGLYYSQFQNAHVIYFRSSDRDDGGRVGRLGPLGDAGWRRQSGAAA
jgi:hypothetical protein